ncbi:23S rRNA (pseudouridine(1915)-N(3))-methyltransferase RlmH [Luteolibacter sp. AS25]|uniref:23S rRNA (pseudouridine(1915)-N(3))-methyltransferase RlmH n=1 Tax=Luteolibacter sp. AS25 TaxID=3135776 RepID=UPI00398B8C8E
MRILIIVAGKPALAFSKLATTEYLKRLSRYGDYQLKFVKDGDSDDVSSNLLKASEGYFRIALDERGLRPTTRELAKTLSSLEMDGSIKRLAFLIGASDGHSKELRENSDMVLSLSSMTMQHELALVVLLEQIYRLATIKAGSPYHRD